MDSTIELALSLLSPPGDTLIEHIEYIGMSQAELAERMGRPKEKINDIIKGKEPISMRTAFQLEKVLGVPASFWLNRESSYRRELHELKQQAEFAQHEAWANSFPLRAMVKLGWLPEANETHLVLDNLLKFFAIASPQEWHRLYLGGGSSVSFKASLAGTPNPFALSAWLREGEIQASEMDCEPFDSRRFSEALGEVKELAFRMPEDFGTQLRDICARCGVAVVSSPNLPEAPISGAARWYHNKPLIQLSDRFSTDDHFWLTFFQLAAHIVLHGKKLVFLEEVKGFENDALKEGEAKDFAAQKLLSVKHWREITASAPLSEPLIEAFAMKFRTPPAIIVERLQHDKLIPFTMGNRFKRKMGPFRQRSGSTPPLATSPRP